MKINKTVSNNPKNKIFIGRGRGGKHAKEKKSRGRPRLLSDQDISSKWTLQEKTKLLKGLKIYEANDLKALSEMVASKTPDEVEELIQAMRTAETKRCHYQLPAG
ncbi:uncharacterized protein LOC131946803 [Physella acuta]|uniref:uncharacterized protein LOC131946803 n=1 Tax=Physella acuta TaxID=109671 RepID=UPI0027DB4DC3|nr:uncharacterized protein LOC131946803 [Physella acuta]